MSFAMNSGVLAVGASLKRVVLLSIPDLTDTAELQNDGDVRSLSFSPLGDMLAGGGADDTHGPMTHKTRGSEMKVVIWRVSPDKTQFNQTFAVLLGHHLLTFLRKHAGHWDVPAEKVVSQSPKWTDRYSHVSFSSDGSWLATACFGSSVVALVPVEDQHGLGTTSGFAATSTANTRDTDVANDAEEVRGSDREG